MTSPEPKPTPGQPRQTPASVLKIFLESRSSAHHTVEDLDSFASYVRNDGNRLLAIQTLFSSSRELANTVVSDWRDSLARQKKAPGTIMRRLSSLRGLAKFMKALGVTSWLIEVTFKPPRPVRDRRSLSVEVAQRIPLLASETDSRSRRDVAILLLVDRAHLNRAEIVALQLADYSPNPSSPSVTTASGLISLPLDAKKALDAWVEVRGLATGPLFVGFVGAYPSVDETLSPDDLVDVVRASPAIRPTTE